ncbi:hypothetical protein C0991_006605, partial [Blastosporella zonata]
KPKGVGKKIHVVGSPQFGFKIEIEHSFNWMTTRSFDVIGLFLLCSTDSSNIVDRITDGASIITPDINQNDKFEIVAGTIQAPRASSNGVMPNGTVSEVTAALKYDIPGLRRCQEWAVDYIEALVKAKLVGNDEAKKAIAEAKKLNPIRPPTSD